MTQFISIADLLRANIEKGKRDANRVFQSFNPFNPQNFRDVGQGIAQAATGTEENPSALEQAGYWSSPGSQASPIFWFPYYGMKGKMPGGEPLELTESGEKTATQMAQGLQPFAQNQNPATLAKSLWDMAGTFRPGGEAYKSYRKDVPLGAQIATEAGLDVGIGMGIAKAAGAGVKAMPKAVQWGLNVNPPKETLSAANQVTLLNQIADRGIRVGRATAKAEAKTIATQTAKMAGQQADVLAKQTDSLAKLTGQIDTASQRVKELTTARNKAHRLVVSNPNDANAKQFSDIYNQLKASRSELRKTELKAANLKAEIAKGKVSSDPVLQKVQLVIEDATNKIDEVKKLRHGEKIERSVNWQEAYKEALQQTGGDPVAANKLAKKAFYGEYSDIAEVISSGLNENDIKQLINQGLDNFPENYSFSRSRFIQAVDDVFRQGKRPTESEITSFRAAWGIEMADTIEAAYTKLGSKAWGTFLDITNMPRSILASFDVSAPLRQGAVLFARHPIEGFKSMGSMFKALGSEAGTKYVDDMIKARKHYQKGVIHKLYTAPIDSSTSTMTTLAHREEAFVSRLISKGKHNPIRLSERSYVSFLNDMRSRVWEQAVDTLEKNGDATEAVLDSMADFINVASGRGNLGRLNQSMPILNNILFSPRYIASRFQLPKFLVGKNVPQAVRVEAWKTLGSFTGMGASALGLLSASGVATVEGNPLSSDFIKVKVGNTRYDIWTGYSQISRLLAQFGSGKRKTISTGETIEANRAELIAYFARTKLSPVAGFLADLMQGETMIGDEIFPTNPKEREEQIRNRLLPFAINDIVEAILDSGGVDGFLKGSPGIMGVGVQTFVSKIKSSRGANPFRKSSKRSGKNPFRR